MKLNLLILRRMLSISFLLLLCYPPKLKAQNSPLSVSGKVTDENGKGLNSVTIQVKGTSNATSTSEDGTFRITGLTGKERLVMSYVGYQIQEIPVNNRAVINITLGLLQNMMDDVIVVGYGTIKKSDVTGALTSISAKTIQERPSTNVLQTLQGKAAGMNVSSNIKPGETPVVRIRGTRSISFSNDPLYVVDGIPIVAALGVNSFSINDLNPNDIASIEILKDASATAIYGSRGANGVILISTKKGTKGKVAVNYNSTVTLDRFKSLTDWMDAGQWVDRWREALINGRNYQTTTNTSLNQAPTIGYPDPFLDLQKMGFGTDRYSQESIWMGYEWDVYGITPKKRASTAEELALGWPAQVPVYNSRNIRDFDWLGQVVRQGVTQNHQVSLSSGTETSKLYLSLGYNNQLGVQKDQDFERFNLNLNGDITPTKWLTLGTSILASMSKQNFGINANLGNTGTKDLYGRAADQFRYAQPRDTSGNFIRNPGGQLNTWNPLVDIDQSINERRSSSIMANVFSEIKFTPWLKYRVNFGAQLRNFRNGSWTGPNVTGHLNATPNTAGYSREENFSWVVENLLFFDKTFAKVHRVGVTLLQSSQQSRRENTNANVQGTVNPLNLWYDLASNTNGRPIGYGTGFTENTLTSFMGRVNYTLMDKYLLTASARYDGSSVLAPGHKWDFFPSFALAWKMHEEKFISGINWINEIKPRIGYGITGNSSVNPYTTTGPLSRNNYVFGSTPAIGFLPQLVKNPDLKWEQTAQWNIGLDFSVLKRRLSGSVELYRQNTSDIIFERTIPAVSGYVTKINNVGKTMNKGIEITLSTVNIDKGDFTWSTELNYSRNIEKIVELINGKEDMLANRLFIGQPINVFYHYDNAGIWGNSSKDLAEMAKFNAAPGNHRFYPGTIKIVDQLTVDTNGDGIMDAGDYRINASDYVIRGTSRPKWSGGITNTFRYKNWSLSSFIYARIGQTYFGGYPNSYGGNFPNGRVENDIWSWTNPNGRWPQAVNGTLVDNFTPAMQYNDGSFVTVRNISLIYDLPAQLIKRASIKNVQLNIQVLNPFIFGGDIVKWGLNPDDDTNWGNESLSNSNSTAPLGGVNNNTILPQSIVFGLRVGL
ncbi:MAG: SusC/RagA family TonB-linked outer membrane protein [Ferruginibacter sp.]|nr:SusC/RagA family TonB-linked outer membrane protein [Ferruginibacter sp.]